MNIAIAMELIALAIKIEPSIQAAITTALSKTDISDADLAAIRSHENASVAALGDAIAAAKAATPA